MTTKDIFYYTMESHCDPILIPISLFTLYWQIQTFTCICIGIPYTASLSINWYTCLRIFLIKMIKCKYRYNSLVRSNKQLKNNFKLFYGKNTKFTVKYLNLVWITHLSNTMNHLKMNQLTLSLAFCFNHVLQYNLA